MKRLRLFFLSVALVVLFNTSAFAVDVLFSGYFFAAGMYQDRTNFLKDGGYHLDPGPPPGPCFAEGPSTAFYYQMLRVKTEFVFSPGLKLITRFDAMKRAWGASRSASMVSDGMGGYMGAPLDRGSAGTMAEHENIAFDWAYIEYISPIGLFSVGYQDDGGWGTVFGDSSVPQGMISWFAGTEADGGVFFQIIKMKERSRTAKNPAFASDNDTDKFQTGFFYKWKNKVEVGLLGVYYRDRSNRLVTEGETKGNIFCLQPYAILQLGPVKLQGEVQYAWGDIKAEVWPGPYGHDLKINNLIGWLDGVVDIKQFYLGGTFAYVAGNDWNKFYTEGQIKGGFLTGGIDWNPTLILFNNERQYWAGTMNGNNLTSSNMNFIAQAFGIDDTGMYNAWFFQLRGGVRPFEKLDVMATVSYALADSKTLPSMAPEAVSNVYGTEIDLIGTYKITNNLSYMMGAGYLFTGDYFKGFDPTAQVRNNYLLINKLTLTF